MSVSGSFAQLSRLANGLRNLDATLAKTPKKLAAKAAEMTRASSAAQRTPEGGAWQRGPATSPTIGRKSGAMLGSIRGTSAGLSFSVRVGRRYAWYFQHGAIHREGVTNKLRRSKLLGVGRGRRGPRQRVTFAGPMRKGRERGFQQGRGIVPAGALPSSWVGPLEKVVDSQLRSDLRL